MVVDSHIIRSLYWMALKYDDDFQSVEKTECLHQTTVIYFYRIIDLNLPLIQWAIVPHRFWSGENLNNKQKHTFFKFETYHF